MNIKFNKTIYTFSILYILLAVVFVWVNNDALAQSTTEKEIKKKIEDRNVLIKKLEGEINKHEADLRIVGKEKKTLQRAIKTLDISRKKISTDISLTKYKIKTTDLTLEEIKVEIANKEETAVQNKKAIAKTIRTIYEIESNSPIETILANKNLSETWDQITTLERFQLVMREDVKKLALLKKELEIKKKESEKQRFKLSTYKKELAGKKKVLDNNRSEKDQLLTVTKSKEVSYQQLLATKRAAQKRFEKDLQNLESQLKYTLNPNSIPSIGQGILGWPLKKLKVTQYFGNTPFAKSGGYNGKGHNGIDLRASEGTSVYASLGGTVKAINLGSVRYCQYGKWILVQHNNGLSTLYAHLSVVSVKAGQTVSTGDVIGFSGNTGYSIGPHLHFTTYIADAVVLTKYTCKSNGRVVTIPIAPYEAYLNPLDYLQDADSLR